MSYQSVTVLGNVGKDPVVRSTSSGDRVVNFSIATSEKRKGVETTVWFNCVAFGKTAEIAELYVRKGSKVLVAGRIQTREYEKDGAKVQAWEVVIDRLSLESSRAEGQSSGGTQQRSDPYNAPLDDEIPF